MSDSTVLTFETPSLLGKVASVDTSRVLIAVENASLLPRAAVGSLVAIQGTTAQEFLIGMTERVTRQLREQTAQPDPMAPTTLEMEIVPDDSLRVVLLGTYRTIEGSLRNRFKRGADSFPQIDRDCFLIEGGNLQRFMGLLGKDLDEKQRLELGHFVIDSSAAAIANGDHFFQRHAAILGSTGSGKSCAVSLILERANARKHANIIVFDMHGEYASLANPPDREDGTKPSPIASLFKIAGPGDLDKPQDNVLFLPYWLLNREEMISMIVDRSDQNAPNQAARFTTHVKEFKDATLKDEKQETVRATFTVDSPVPYKLTDLLAKLRDDDTGMKPGASKAEIKGDWNGKLTRFISRLEAKAEDRRYGFMFKPPADALKYDWLSQSCLLRTIETTGSKSWTFRKCRQTCSLSLPAYSHDCFTMCSSGCSRKSGRRLCSCATKPISICPFVRTQTRLRNRPSTRSSASLRKAESMVSLCWWSVSAPPTLAARFLASAIISSSFG